LLLIDEPELKAELSNLLSSEEKRKISTGTDYHFLAMPNIKMELINFMNEFYKNTSIPTDFVYTGKLFFGILT
jgi:1-aminocyclopropane-1-carboxylate deaminase